MNPGLGVDTIEEIDNSDEEDFGLMGPFVSRWRTRLKATLASGAGAEVHIPPGNPELYELLEEYD